MTKVSLIRFGSDRKEREYDVWKGTKSVLCGRIIKTDGVWLKTRSGQRFINSVSFTQFILYRSNLFVKPWNPLLKSDPDSIRGSRPETSSVFLQNSTKSYPHGFPRKLLLLFFSLPSFINCSWIIDSPWCICKRVKEECFMCIGSLIKVKFFDFYFLMNEF